MVDWAALIWSGRSWRRSFLTIATAIALALLIAPVCDFNWAHAGMSYVAKLPSILTKIVPPSPKEINKSRFAMSPDTGSQQLEALKQADLEKLSSSQLEDLYFSILKQLHVRCPTSERIGEVKDGGWDVCMSAPFDIRQSRPCIAFSFGINDIWGYDDLLAEKYKCRVYMFDPSMKNITDHKRKNTSWFYLTGVAASNGVTKKGWKMRTLCHLLEELGYADKTIDILKVDIEFFEWESFEQAFKDGCLVRVKQLLFESHTSELNNQKSDYKMFIRVWRGLFDIGFRSWKSHENPISIYYRSSPNSATRACCYEHYLININFFSDLA